MQVGWICPTTNVRLNAHAGSCALQPDCREGDRGDVRQQQPGRSLRHHIRHVVVRGVGKHGQLFDQRLSPRRVPVDEPVTGLPLGGRREHSRGLAALGIDLNHARNVDLQPLNHRGSVGLVLDEHGADRAMHVPLPPDLGFGRRRIQVPVDDVQDVPLAPLDADDADRHVV